MRIDKFLNSVNITKRRSVAQDMLKSKVVLLNGQIAKQSKDVAVGDRIELIYFETKKQYKVLELPTTKSTPKSQQSRYIQELI